MREEILVSLQGLCTVYNVVMSKQLLQIWTSVLSDLTPDEIVSSVKKYLLDPENVFFPKPAQIYALARPKIETKQEAMLIVDRIFYSLRAYGTDKLNEGRARQKIGAIGWKFIENKGGWEAFSTSVTSNDQVPILQAQARDSISGLLQMKESGLEVREKIEDNSKFTAKLPSPFLDMPKNDE